MSVQWTQAQQAAIADRGGTLLVSAAAGSGKTAVLVERAVQLICDEHAPVPADRLLIVTFTRAAAEELRARIGARLAQLSQERPGSLWLRRQKMLLGRADIGTIDSFCMQLLQRYFMQLQLPPDFAVADDATSYSLRTRALEQTLEEMYEDIDFCAFASQYGRARTDYAAGAAVLAYYDFLRTLPHSHRKAEAFCAQYETAAPIEETRWGAVLLDSATQAVAGARAMTQAAINLCYDTEGLMPYLAAVQEDAVFLERLAALIAQKQWDTAAQAVLEYKPKRLPGVKGAPEQEKELFKAMRGEAKELLDGMRKNIFVCSNEEFQQDCRRIAPMLRALTRAALRFEELFFSYKLEERVLEYSDLEHLALKLLCAPDGSKTQVAKEVSACYDAVMVDEYQDTNSLQAILYECLANDERSNLFFVGDVKQSIYRFRLADPRSFLNKREAFAEYQNGAKHPMRLALSHNFRSAPRVIDAINDVFSCVMSVQTGAVTYDQSERLHAGVDGAYVGEGIQLALVAQREEGDADAAVVAQTIQRMLQEGFCVRDGTQVRACRPEDFCILLRSRSAFAAYEQALEQAGLAVCVDSADSPLTAAEVVPMLSLLRVLNHPLNEVALAGAMLSPLLGFSAEDLARLREQYPQMTLYGAVCRSAQPRMQLLAQLLAQLRRLAATESVAGLCDEILMRTHYLAAVSAMENGQVRRERLRSFLAWASSAGAGGLPAFLRMVDSVLESGGSIGSPPPVLARGQVSIMTIHRSKGLEFPIVLVADTARQFYLRDAYASVLFHQELGVGMSVRLGEGDLLATAPQRALRMLHLREAVDEEMRILYVALTRARDRLMVFAALKSPASELERLAMKLKGMGGAVPCLTQAARSFSDWLCMAALLHPCGRELRRCAGVPDLPLMTSAQGELVGVLKECPDSKQVQRGYVPVQQPDKALTAALLAQFARAYPHRELSQIPVKLSVSELSHREQSLLLQRPAFAQQERMTAAERGTAAHTVLQFIARGTSADTLEAEVCRLVQGGWLSARAAEQTDLQSIRRFLQTELWQRMCKAERLLREYPFLTAIDAKYVLKDITPAYAHCPIAVQGIADAVLINGSTAELVDYKTDRVSDAQSLALRYRTQLLLYCAAMEKRLNVKVERCTIYSLHHDCEVPVSPDWHA